MGSIASVSAAKSNKFFKAKRMRDDLMFQKEMSAEKDVDRSAKNIIKSLKEMELKWIEGKGRGVNEENVKIWRIQ